MKATLTNDFHGSSVTVQIPDIGILSERTTKRVNRELCGISSCECGGIRGPQDGVPDGYCVDETTYYPYLAILPRGND